MANLAKNTTFMTLGSIGQKFVAFVYFAVIARFVGVEDLGKYTTALAFTTILVVFVDLGITNVLVREVARQKQNVQDYLGTILGIKIGLGLLSYLFLTILVYTLGYEPELRGMILLSGVTMLLDSAHLALYGALRGLGNLKYEAGAMVVSQLLTLLLGSLFLFLKLPLIFLILAFTIPSALNVLYALSRVRKVTGIFPRPRANTPLAKKLMKIAIPFALAAVFARVYGYLDTLLLQKLTGNEQVGFYGVAQKITYAFQFIPLALIAGVYPKMSEFFESKKEKLPALLMYSLKYLLIVVFPIAFGIAALAEPIVGMVFGAEFMSSVLPLQILILSLIFSFVSFPLGALLNACNKQGLQTMIVALVMLVNISANIVLIPKFGAVGAACAAAGGNALLALLGYMAAPRITTVAHGALLSMVLRIFLAGALMAVAVLALDGLHLFVQILSGAVIYVGLILLFRIVRIQDMNRLRSMVS